MTDFVGTQGNDTIVGTANDDVIYTGTGSDTIEGGDGNDVIDLVRGIWSAEDSNYGSETLTVAGGAGNDVFIFDQGTGGDVIGDFTIGQDRIDLSAYGLTFAQLQTLFAQNGNVIVLHNVTMSQLTASDFILTPVAEGPPKNDADVMDVAGAFADDAASGLFADDAGLMGEGLIRWQPVSGDMFV